MAPNGSGISPTITSPVRFRSSTSFTPASTFGMWHANYIPPRRPNRNAGWPSIRTNCWMKARSKNSWSCSVPSIRSLPNYSKRSAPKPTTLTKIRNACDTPITARNTSLSAPASSKQAAKRSLLPAANSPACSGPFAAQTPSWRYAAAISTRGLRITGSAGTRPDFHFYVAHPIITVVVHGIEGVPERPWTPGVDKIYVLSQTRSPHVERDPPRNTVAGQWYRPPPGLIGDGGRFTVHHFQSCDGVIILPELSANIG